MTWSYACRAALPMLAAAFACAALAAHAGGATSPSSGGFSYTLGPEVVPNGAFDRVGPKWQQIRPDEGEDLAVIPEGWLFGYQGGARMIPIPGVDPDTGSRCMDFLYGAGRVDIYTPSVPLAGAGTYILSMRTRSVVNPSDHALRAVLRLLPSESAAPGDREISLDARLAAGPPERAWAVQTALFDVPPGVARAELHLIKDDAFTDFLVDDVSLRRIEAAPDELRLEGLAPGEPPSRVLFLGAVESARIEAASVVAGEPAVEVDVRTGTTAAPGSSWEDWRGAGPAAGGTEAPIHLFASGVPLYAQVRVRPADRASGADRPAPPRTIVLRTTPWKKTLLTRNVSIIATANGPLGADEASRDLVLPDALECVDGPLAPIRALAIAATSGIPGDAARAAAIAQALISWAPFTAAESPLEGSLTPDPSLLLEDCRRPTPLLCRNMEADLFTAACWCLGMICRAVSGREAGAPDGGIEGMEVWSTDLHRWIFQPFLLPPREVRASPVVAGLSPSPEPPAAAGRGGPVAVATDLTWGKRGWKILEPGAPSGQGKGDKSLAGGLAEINQVHADLAASGERSLEVRLSHTMPGFARFLYRYSRAAPWTPVEGAIHWNLAPGENVLDLQAENATGGRGGVTTLIARLFEDPKARAAAYAGLRALDGDPHVHTGLGLYRLLDPNRPVAIGTDEGAFAAAIRNGLSWAAVTDYAGNIDDRRTVEWRRSKRKLLRNPDGSQTDSEWEHLRAVVRSANQPGRFAAFLGSEWDGEGLSADGGSGHKLILMPDESADRFCSPNMQNAGDCPVLHDAYRFTREHGGIMIAATPCAAAGGSDTDWSRHDPIVALMEMSGGVCEKSPGGLVDVSVRRGLAVGAGGGSDSRTANAGENDRTICWAAEIGRGPILDAIRARRCYWSAAGHLDLTFTVNGAPMGAQVEPGDVTAWSVVAVGGTSPAFGSVEVLRDGEVIASSPCESPTRCVLEGGAGEGWPGVYYAAITGLDGARLAIASPIRVAAGPTR